VIARLRSRLESFVLGLGYIAHRVYWRIAERHLYKRRIK
jgi:hypothetical protein